MATRSLPPAGFILSPDEFSQALEAKQAEIDARLWENIGSLVGKEQDIQELAQSFRDAITEFNGFGRWQLAALDAGRDHAGARRSWDELIREIKELRELHAGYQPGFIKHYPVIVEEPTVEIQKKIAEEILVHLRNGGELRERKSFSFSRAIRKGWRVAYESWRVNDRAPEAVEEFVAIERLLSIKIKRAAIGKIWDRLMASNAGPAFADLGENPERGADQFAHQITEALNWLDLRWFPPIKKLCAMGCHWDRFLSLQPFHKDGETLRSIVAVDKKLFAELRLLEKRVLGLGAQKKLEGAFKQLEPFDRPEVVELRRAMQLPNAVGYQQARKKCVEAAERQATVLRRNELLGRLGRRTPSGMPIAEEWAASIRNRVGVHGKPKPPGDATEAWEWRQLNDELERRGTVDLGEVGGRIAAIHDELKRTTCELIDQRAWAGQVRRTSLKQRQALMNWLDTVKRIGKGTGKRVPQYRREAQRLMEECRTAVPVW